MKHNAETANAMCVNGIPYITVFVATSMLNIWSKGLIYLSIVVCVRIYVNI